MFTRNMRPDLFTYWLMYGEGWELDLILVSAWRIEAWIRSVHAGNR